MLRSCLESGVQLGCGPVSTCSLWAWFGLLTARRSQCGHIVHMKAGLPGAGGGSSQVSSGRSVKALPTTSLVSLLPCASGQSSLRAAQREALGGPETALSRSSLRAAQREALPNVLRFYKGSGSSLCKKHCRMRNTAAALFGYCDV